MNSEQSSAAKSEHPVDRKVGPFDDQRFTILLEKVDGRLTVSAGIAAEYESRWQRPRDFAVFEPTEEDLEDMDPEDREYYETRNPKAEYLQRLAEIAKNQDEITERCDLLARTLSQTTQRTGLPDEVHDAATLASSIVGEARQATPEMYASLPDSTKRLVEYCDRVTQLDHLFGGSSYTTPMETVYTEGEANECIEDFFVAAEKSLEETFAKQGKNISVALQRPERVVAINGASNLVFAIINKINESSVGDGALSDDTWDEVFKKIATGFTRKYIQGEDLPE